MKVYDSDQSFPMDSSQDVVTVPYIPPVSAYRMRKHAENAMTKMMNTVIDQKCDSVVAKQTLLAHFDVAMLAAQASRLMPQEEAFFRKIVECNFENLYRNLQYGSEED